jgi:hypothetical protein
MFGFFGHFLTESLKPVRAKISACSTHLVYSALLLAAKEERKAEARK